MGLIRIMKKTYIAPTMEITEIGMVSMIAASGLGFDSEHEGGYEQLSNGRRGTWGDRWSD